MKTVYFTTKREGYGRQGLYFTYENKEYYIQSVFPNIEEHFDSYATMDDCFEQEDGTFQNVNGKEVTPINSWQEFLNKHFKERIKEILQDAAWEIEEEAERQAFERKLEEFDY
jgi:hypothetical protein